MKIKNAKVFLDGKFQNLEVQYQDGIITKIDKFIPDNDDVDANGMYLYAGMIDTHIHGGYTCSFYESDNVDFSNGEEQVREICRRLPYCGVTSCLPTFDGSTPLKSLIKSTRLIRKVRKDIKGADPFQLHYEGPYMNPKQTASNFPQFQVNPSKEHTMAMTDNDLSDVKLICIAPELPGAMEWIDWVTKQGVLTEICYTQATSDQVRKAADHGLSQASHLYNGYQPMHHRINGPAIGTLLDDRINAQITCDGMHVSSDWIRLAIRVKGLDHLYGITDMSSFSGLPEGKHKNPFFGEINVKGNTVTDNSGMLLGGNMVWNEIMRAAKEKIGLSMEEIGSIYSENPAKCLGITDRGKIEVGRRADFTIMDENYQVLQTIIKGETYYKA